MFVDHFKCDVYHNFCMVAMRYMNLISLTIFSHFFHATRTNSKIIKDIIYKILYTRKYTRFFIRNQFIRNLHVESKKIKKLLQLHFMTIF